MPIADAFNDWTNGVRGHHGRTRILFVRQDDGSPTFTVQHYRYQMPGGPLFQCFFAICTLKRKSAGITFSKYEKYTLGQYDKKFQPFVDEMNRHTAWHESVHRRLAVNLLADHQTFGFGHGYSEESAKAAALAMARTRASEIEIMVESLLRTMDMMFDIWEQSYLRDFWFRFIGAPPV